MAGTTLTDIIVPELFDPYVIQKTMELNAFYQSGIITNNAHFDALASEAAPIHNMPFFEDLKGDPEDVIEGADLTADKITSSSDVSTTIRRAKMWSATDLSAAMAGADPMAAIGGLVAGYWARQMQKEIITELTGVFAATSMKDHILDISGGTDNAANISASAFIDALQLLGDAQGDLTAVAMHSATKSYLKKQNLITTERDSTDVEFEAYQGRRVIVDDGCPNESGVCTTYLFGAGAVALGNGSPVGFVPTEIDRDKRKGSGVDYLINRKTFILHPRGVAWQNKARAHAETVSRTELANGTNWKAVFEPKAIRIVALKHKVG
ncbi:major capsid protein [Megasphaera vaginalis (ex Srinivasan et al. 2021)]|uniref:Putative coat protein n=1 Tax=Megasphaera vaginalis (ex Srinivasan et al. 2021) TaxID=1111454 RepID=U7UJ28_9FIRM|nr:major capsid protein [Megasphaera vaginalis (ex Srinivasan et al. 2021)]ERT59340.1 putative coat protein [Megasphaera vaginalis (ex Srinivasan et al. 2021)]